MMLLLSKVTMFSEQVPWLQHLYNLGLDLGSVFVRFGGVAEFRERLFVHVTLLGVLLGLGSTII